MISSPMADSSPAVLGWCALPLLALVLGGCGSHESRTEQSLRETALAYPRPVEGRLSVTARFAPWSEALAVPRQAPDLLSAGETKRVLRGSRPALGGQEPEELHRVGLLWLYHGEAARAVSALEAVADHMPSAAVLSDLSAAYLALAEDNSPWLRVDAIAAASRAVERAPGEPYAAFNLALALERMSLAHEASLAWERYLDIEDDKAWHQEASERLARLREPTPRGRWEAEKDRVASATMAGDQANLARLARQFPGQIKELLEGDLLSAWAEVAGTPAGEARLAVAKRVAEALARTGERLYADAIHVIESRADASQVLADGHRAYARGLVLRGDCSQAMPAFERALEQLSAGGSPLAWAARFRQLVCIYRRRAPDAEEPLAELASELDGRPYPALLANVEALRGLCAMSAGRYSQAIAHYERAVQLLERAGDTDVMRIYGMLDEAYRFLGDRDNAWRYRLEALRRAMAAGDRKARHAILAGLARELAGGGRREAAQAVLGEMVANARAWSEPGAEAEALLRRIQLDLQSGAYDRAAVDIAACTRLLERFRQPADRARLKAELMVASAERLVAVNPAEALQRIQAAVSRLETSGDGLLLPRALLGLARVRVLLGEADAAEETFERALRIYETRREDTAAEEHRISFFSTVQASFDAMIRFQALERGDAHAAFTYSERVRARALRDRLGSGRMEPLPLHKQLDRIPPNVAVFSYAVLPETLLVWRLRQGSLEMHALPATRDEVANEVASLRATLTGASSIHAGKAATARAFELLLRPAIEDLPAETELVFLPDRELYQIPFPALFNTSRGRYLIEDHACLIAPSLDLYLSSQERRATAVRKPRRVLAAGDPAFDSALFPALRPLPHARKEAPAVAALYEEALSLVGEEATRQRILDGLPGSDVLHLAAHVVIDPGNPLGSLVATAGRDREPLRASDLDIGRLAGVELVFLAACDTAPGFADGDREGVAGLARSFLAAGVPSVVATLWAVDDEAAARLAVVFHARLLEGEPPVHALRLAQLALMSEPSFPVPLAWAPFQLFHGA